MAWAVDVAAGVTVMIYALVIILLLFYTLAQVHLVFKVPGSSLPAPVAGDKILLPVTVQLPVYNEPYVVERLLRAIANLDYPRHLLQIQIADDSTDETLELIQNLLSQLDFGGAEVMHIRRNNRQGYKAGALQNALGTATGEIIAVFDADFVPEKNFLIKTVPYFISHKADMVQTRWTHLNENAGLLTSVQAFALDVHFLVQQPGRYAGGFFFHFNGTAGLWRKAAIEAAGGWQHDTLTEDLDLSIRASFAGAKCMYVGHVTVPAELPTTLSGVSAQQARWTKGAAQNLKKHFFKVMNSALWPADKLHALVLLAGGSVYALVLPIALLTLPLAFIKFMYPWWWPVTLPVSLAGACTLLFVVPYTYALYIHGNVSFVAAVKKMACFMCYAAGMSAINFKAAWQGFSASGPGEFIRTPKKPSATFNAAKDRSNKKLFSRIEFFLLLYFLISAVICPFLHDWPAAAFCALHAAGNALILYWYKYENSPGESV